MHRILLIALVSVSVSLAEHLKCSQFCKLLSLGYVYDESRSNACNCYAEKQHKKEAFRPWSEIGPVVKLDDSGIYYEPAEIYPFAKLSYKDRPFYIVNPATRHNTQNTAAAKEDKLSNKHTKSLFKNYHKYIDDGYNTSTRKQKRKDITYQNLALKTKSFQSYLDVDLKELTDVFRDVSIDEIGVPFLTEEDLNDCLDIYILVHARRKNNSTKWKQMLSDKNFVKYSDLTDSQLKSEIIDKCSQLTKIVEQSRKEILENIPQKNQSELRETENVDSTLHEELNLYQHKVIKNTDEKEDRDIVTSTIADIAAEETASIFNENNYDTNFQEKRQSTQYDEKITTPNILNKNVDQFDYSSGEDTLITSTLYTTTTDNTNYNEDNIETIPSYLSESDMGQKKLSHNLTKKSDLYKIQSKTSNSYNSGKNDSFERSTIKPIGLAYPTDRNNIETHATHVTEALTTDNSDNSSNFNLYLTTTPSIVEHREPSEENELNNVAVILSESSTADDFINDDNLSKEDNELSVTKKYFTNLAQETGDHNIEKPRTYDINNNLYDSTDANLLTYTNSLDNDISATTLTNNTKKRHSVSKEDIKLLGITTTELSNHTVWSEVNDTEQLVNNGIKKDATLKANRDNNGTTKLYNISNNQVNENVKNESEIFNQNITGKLYFYFNKQNIPARFIQNPADGQIHVGIDGISLCDKLNITNDTSKLLSVLCNCVQTERCGTR